MPTKTEQTRTRLLTAALELFAEHGYDATSVSHIAQRAGVSDMTFFRYFPTKESVLVDDPYDPMIAAAVADQPITLDLLTRAARGIRSAWHSVPFPDSVEVRERVQIVARTPSLRSTLARNSSVTEAAVAEALGGDPAARIAAAAALAALNTALLEWSLTDDGELGSAIDAALDVLEAPRG